jgi:hypothetical protein
METKFYETPECYKDERGKYSLNLKRGESITIWAEDSIVIIPRVSNSVKIETK